MRPLNIAYVTMRFPLPSETFACNDIQALISMGHEVEVFCLREKHKDHDALVNERGLQDIAIHHVSLKSMWCFFAWMLMHPLMFLSVFFWNLYYCLLKPKHLLKSLALFPAACLHFHSIHTKRPDVVHLFWGHYTSLTGYLVSRFMPTTVLTQFLGAHHLRALTRRYSSIIMDLLAQCRTLNGTIAQRGLSYLLEHHITLH